jgi:hypothetical protein
LLAWAKLHYKASTPSIASASTLYPRLIELVQELKTMLGASTHHEITATETAIAAPLSQFNQFRNFCSSITRTKFLVAAGHNVPELTRIDVFIASISRWSQFDSHVHYWKTTTSLVQRTLKSLLSHLASLTIWRYAP